MLELAAMKKLVAMQMLNVMGHIEGVSWYCCRRRMTGSHWGSVENFL